MELKSSSVSSVSVNSDRSAGLLRGDGACLRLREDGRPPLVSAGGVDGIWRRLLNVRALGVSPEARGLSILALPRSCECLDDLDSRRVLVPLEALEPLLPVDLGLGLRCGLEGQESGDGAGVPAGSSESLSPRGKSTERDRPKLVIAPGVVGETLALALFCLNLALVCSSSARRAVSLSFSSSCGDAARATARPF